MAKSKDDIKYGTAQAKLSEDQMARVVYKAGTPIEGGKIADSEPVHLFSSAHQIEKAKHHDQTTSKKDAHRYAETSPTSTSINDKP